MKRTSFLFMLMMANISCLPQKAIVFDEITERLSEDYYVSTENNILVFLKVEQDVVSADFVFWEKFPIRLASDTLSFDESAGMYVGKISNIRSMKGKPYVCAKKDDVIFFSDVTRCLKCDEVEYKERITEKNYAVWHELWVEYRERNVPEAMRIFNELREERDISDKLENLSFEDFMKEVRICRELLFPSH